jgi:ribosomal protein S18 acetylase RimI-like enzyme
VEIIVALLVEDELGASRENLAEELDAAYIDAFNKIYIDPNQYLMVVEKGHEIVGTCHLTMMPSLTFKGSTRMQIEAVRVADKYRGQKIGEWMIKEALEYGKLRGAKLIQLTTNKKRDRAKKFYETLGFEATHEGMKLSLY